VKEKPEASAELWKGRHDVQEKFKWKNFICVEGVLNIGA